MGSGVGLVGLDHSICQPYYSHVSLLGIYYEHNCTITAIPIYVGRIIRQHTFQICRFCWHRLRTDENGLCPACRQPYPEDPVNFKPLTASDVQKMKTEKRQKQQLQKIKICESRKHLSSYRFVFLYVGSFQLFYNFFFMKIGQSVDQRIFFQGATKESCLCSGFISQSSRSRNFEEA